MKSLLEILFDWIDAAPVAWCRLVETRGSTPQKAGALMLIRADGAQAGTLGGGCVEAEVKRRALQALAEGRPGISRFQLDSDYGWDDGLICGGRMQVLLQPLVPPLPPYFHQLREQLAAGRGVCEAVLLENEGENGIPRSWLFNDESELLAVLPAEGAEEPHPRGLEERPRLADRPRPSARGGIAFLPTLPRCRLVIVGGGHVGQAVARLAAELEFDVWVVDDRADIISPERFPTAQRRIAGPVEEVLPPLPIDQDTYCLIVTRGHNHDERALYHLAERGARYVGLIGSRRKLRLIFDDLLREGIAPESLAAVHAPVGIDIGSQTVAEIAVSIAAELVAHRNRGGTVPGRPSGVAVSRAE